jgi:hypothetical protein
VSYTYDELGGVDVTALSSRLIIDRASSAGAVAAAVGLETVDIA